MQPLRAVEKTSMTQTKTAPKKNAESALQSGCDIVAIANWLNLRRLSVATHCGHTGETGSKQ
jgi:hypothetical protein